jgi:hypothetical protein
MALSHSPSIVTDGLVLCLDAANLKSYPGSGVTCNDLSTTVSLSTLQNGTGFDRQNSGRFIFDGTNDKIQVPSPFGNIDWESRAWTASVWGKMDVFGDRGIFTLNNNSTTFFSVTNIIGYGSVFWYFIRSTGSPTQYSYSTPYGPISVNIPYNFVITYNGLGFSSSSNIRFYINGSSSVVNSGGGASRPNLIEGIQLGAEIYPMDGDIYHFSMYNRVLTQTDVTQNFNALRGRFGI